MASGNTDKDSQTSKLGRLKDTFLHVAETLLKCVKLIFAIAFISAAGIWAANNLAEIDRFFFRVISTVEKFSVGGILEVTLGKASPNEYEKPKEWATFVRIQNGLRLKEAHFGSWDGLEYLDVEALTRTRLAGGYVGDSDELLYLIDDGSELRPGETLRIYTYCGPKYSSPNISSKNQNKIWEGACNEMFNSIFPGADSKRKISSTTGNSDYCKMLHEKIIGRKNDQRGTGKTSSLFSSPKSKTYFTKNEFLKSDIEGNQDPNTMARGCHDDLYSKSSESKKAILARCIATIPKKEKKEPRIKCLPMLPRFSGIFKASPGEGDRIVIMDRKKNILLDLDYWWSTTPGSEE